MHEFEQTPTKWIISSPEGTDVRKEPRSDAAIVKWLKYCDVVDVVEELPDEQSATIWLRLIDNQGWLSRNASDGTRICKCVEELLDATRESKPIAAEAPKNEGKSFEDPKPAAAKKDWESPKAEEEQRVIESKPEERKAKVVDVEDYRLATEPAMEKNEDELKTLRVGQLMQLASRMGIAMELIGDAIEKTDAKAALVKLILKDKAKKRPEEEVEEAVEEVKQGALATDVAMLIPSSGIDHDATAELDVLNLLIRPSLQSMITSYSIKCMRSVHDGLRLLVFVEPKRALYKHKMIEFISMVFPQRLGKVGLAIQCPVQLPFDVSKTESIVGLAIQYPVHLPFDLSKTECDNFDLTMQSLRVFPWMVLGSHVMSGQIDAAPRLRSFGNVSNPDLMRVSWSVSEIVRPFSPSFDRTSDDLPDHLHVAMGQMMMEMVSDSNENETQIAKMRPDLLEPILPHFATKAGVIGKILSTRERTWSQPRVLRRPCKINRKLMAIRLHATGDRFVNACAIVNTPLQKQASERATLSSEHKKVINMMLNAGQSMNVILGRFASYPSGVQQFVRHYIKTIRKLSKHSRLQHGVSTAQSNSTRLQSASVPRITKGNPQVHQSATMPQLLASMPQLLSRGKPKIQKEHCQAAIEASKYSLAPIKLQLPWHDAVRVVPPTEDAMPVAQPSALEDRTEVKKDPEGQLIIAGEPKAAEASKKDSKPPEEAEAIQSSGGEEAEVYVWTKKIDESYADSLRKSFQYPKVGEPLAKMWYQRKDLVQRLVKSQYLARMKAEKSAFLKWARSGPELSSPRRQVHRGKGDPDDVRSSSGQHVEDSSLQLFVRTQGIRVPKNIQVFTKALSDRFKNILLLHAEESTKTINVDFIKESTQSKGDAAASNFNGKKASIDFGSARVYAISGATELSEMDTTTFPVSRGVRGQFYGIVPGSVAARLSVMTLQQFVTEAVLPRVLLHGPIEDAILVGLSFGTMIAYAAAHHLEACGRSSRGVFLLDNRMIAPQSRNAPPQPAPMSRRAQIGGGGHYLASAQMRCVASARVLQAIRGDAVPKMRFRSRSLHFVCYLLPSEDVLSWGSIVQARMQLRTKHKGVILCPDVKHTDMPAMSWDIARMLRSSLRKDA